MLVAAMNPTPDGKMPGESRSSPREIQNYLGRISGPLLDRIDLHVEVPPVKFREIAGDRTGETSAQIRERVVAARKRQQARFAHKPKITCNARMGTKEIKEFCALDEATKELLKFAMTDLNLSARAYDRILKVARTIADLAGAEQIVGRPRFRGHPVSLARPADLGMSDLSSVTRMIDQKSTVKLRCRFLALQFLMSVLFAAGAQDRLAEIGAVQATESRALVTLEPPKLPEKVFAHGPHDPQAVFRPGKKLDTSEELAATLKANREQFAPFLESHAPAQPVTRTIRRLESFAWRIATAEDWQNFPAVLAGAGQWQQVKIPHYGEPLGRTNTFYRTTFALDPWRTNEAVFVRFRGVDYKAHVFVNGAFVGSHEGFFAPFEFDITPFVRVGENALFVRVDNEFPTVGVVNDPKYPDLIGDKLYACTGPGFDDPDAGWHHCPPGMGIYQPVSIEVRPRVHVHDIFVRPLPEKQSAEALVEVWNCDTEPRNIEVHFSVFGLNFTQQILTNQAIGKTDPAGGGVNFYRVRFPMPQFRLWSLDEPWLYDFQVTVACPKLGITDNAGRHFGMRSFRLDESGAPKGRFFLNGQEIRLHGANTMGFEQQDVMRGDLGQLRDDLLLAKIAHMNYLRITQRPVQEEVYDMADRLGLMIQTDFPLFGHMRPNQFGEGVRQVTEMERLIRSHPSCVLVTYINERFSDQKSKGKMSRRMNRPEFERFFRAADEAVLFANPDRVIKAVEGDYDPPAPDYRTTTATRSGIFAMALTSACCTKVTGSRSNRVGTMPAANSARKVSTALN